MVMLDVLIKMLSEDLEKKRVVSYSVINLEDNTTYEDYRYLPYNIKNKIGKLLPITLGEVTAFLSVSHIKNYMVLVDIEKEEKLAVIIVFRYPSQKDVYKSYLGMLTYEGEVEEEKEKATQIQPQAKISGLESDLKNVKKDLSAVKNEIKEIKNALTNTVSKEFSGLAKQVKQNTSSIDDLYNKYSTVTGIIINLQSLIEDISKTTTKIRKNIEKTQAKISKLEKLMKD